MITQSKQIAHHINTDPTGIANLQNLANVDKISQIDNSGNFISWSYALQSYPSLQGISTIEGNTAYIIDSKSSANYPYQLYPDASGIASDVELAAVSGALETSLTSKIFEGDAIERNFAEAIYEFAYNASGNLSSDITSNFNSLTSRVDDEIAKDTFSVTAPNVGAYTFNGAGTSSALNPSLTLTKGKTYYFDVDATGHPFWLKTVRGTHPANADPVPNAYNTGVTNNGTASGIVTFQVPMNAPTTLYYQCANHAAMYGKINIGSGGGTGGGANAGKGLILDGDVINIEDPAADYQPIGSGVYNSDRPDGFSEALHIANNDRLALWDFSAGSFKYSSLLGLLNNAYLHQINNQLRPTHIDGGAANTYGPFAGTNVVILPAVPENFALTISDSAIEASWNAVNNAESYTIEWSTNGADWTAQLGHTQTSYVISGLNNDTTYYVKVKAVNSLGEGPETETLTGIPTAGVTTTTTTTLDPDVPTTTTTTTEAPLSYTVTHILTDPDGDGLFTGGNNGIDLITGSGDTLYSFINPVNFTPDVLLGQQLLLFDSEGTQFGSMQIAPDYINQLENGELVDPNRKFVKIVRADNTVYEFELDTTLPYYTGLGSNVFNVTLVAEE